VNNLKAWMRIASPEEQESLAAAAGTSRKYLYHLANDHSSYAREASPDLSRKLEAAARPLAAENPRLPRLLRVDLNSACRNCDFAAKCLGEHIISESDFRTEETKPS
jgi:hypothetical protein